MNREELISSIYKLSQLRFARSGGPGGQNVNKVSTACTLHLAIAQLEGLDEVERILIYQKLKNRINNHGELVIHCEETRSQFQNKSLALERARVFVLAALKRETPRRDTKPSYGSKVRRLESKKIAASHKKNRQLPRFD